MKNKSISQTCKLFKDCPLGWDCLLEITRTGSAIWSIELCYDLIDLIDAKFINVGDGHTLLEQKIARGIIYTFATVEGGGFR